MKQKIRYFGFCLFTMFAFYTSANAAVAGISVECSKAVKPGKIVACEINGGSNVKIKELKGEITFTGGLSFNRAEYNSQEKFTVSEITSTTFQFAKDVAFSSDFILGTIYVKVPESASEDDTFSVILNNIELTQMDGNKHTLGGEVKDTMHIVSSNALLSSLEYNIYEIPLNLDGQESVIQENITIPLDETKTTYKIEVPANTDLISFNTKTQNSQATVSSIGMVGVKYGMNEYSLFVTAEDKSIKEYKIQVERKDNRSTNTNLKELGIEYKDSYVSDVNGFLTWVNSEVQEVTIVAKAEDETAVVTGTGTKILAYGSNFFEITVTAQNGNKETYLIHVFRNGKETTCDFQCVQNRSCTIVDGKYYGTLSNEINETEYQKECGKENACTYKNGQYYGKSSVIVNKTEYQKECEKENICIYKNGKYYDIAGYETEKENFNKSCGIVENPNTGTCEMIALSVLLIVASIGTYLFIRKKQIFPKA